MSSRLQRGSVVLVACAVLASVAGTARAQDRADTVTPIRVQVVVSRYQGERKVSSHPYSLSVNVNNKPFGVASLRMGARIPVAMMASPTVDGKDLGIKAGPIQYQEIGTNIDCRANLLDDGRFRLDVTVEDTSVYPDEKDRGSQQPSFRSFKATDAMILRDGQTGQFTTATDKITGEVTKVDVTLTVLK